MFCVVSDPVDPLCRAVLEESNRDETGRWDGGGLFSHQVRGFGLGVMQARAMYYARKEPRFAAFLTEGRVVQANLEMRRLGFKPYVAPALSSGALSLLACLRGQWHCSSTYLDGVFMGARNRLLPTGTEPERLPLPGALQERLRDTMERLRAIR